MPFPAFLLPKRAREAGVILAHLIFSHMKFAPLHISTVFCHYGVQAVSEREQAYSLQPAHPAIGI